VRLGDRVYCGRGRSWLLSFKPKNIDFAQEAGMLLTIKTAHEGLWESRLLCQQRWSSECGPVKLSSGLDIEASASVELEDVFGELSFRPI
jgi:hypothetical protein